MKKPDLMESVRVVLTAAEGKQGITGHEFRHINRLKNWLREQEEVAAVGSRGRAKSGKEAA